MKFLFKKDHFGGRGSSVWRVTGGVQGMWLRLMRI